MVKTRGHASKELAANHLSAYSECASPCARRAVANGHGLAGPDGRNYQNQRRMALAAALGNAGDLEGEVEQVRAVLAAEPGHVHARLTLGQSLLDRGEFEAAVPELLMALQLPDAVAKPPWPSMPPAQVAMMRDNARDALVSAFGRRAQQLAAAQALLGLEDVAVGHGLAELAANQAPFPHLHQQHAPPRRDVRAHVYF